MDGCVVMEVGSVIDATGSDDIGWPSKGAATEVEGVLQAVEGRFRTEVWDGGWANGRNGFIDDCDCGWVDGGTV